LPRETEIKIRISDVPAIQRRLRKLGFRIHARRVFESNVILDTPGRRLRRKGSLIRIRRVDAKSILTYKGRSKKGRHKSREEIETLVADPNALETLFARLGLKPVFQYEKYRTEYKRPSRGGVVMVDETPVGDYLEIEGSPRWIDTVARELGFSRSEYITESYGAIYVQYCRDQGIRPAQMIFQSKRPGKRKGPQANT
jgi:adenylate cyclase class 2